jgi:hypothetical protein
MQPTTPTTTFIDIILPPFIYFIIFIKIIFLIMALSNIYFDKVTHNQTYDHKTIYWKERTEFIFIICMSILLIVIFNPNYNNQRLLTKETKFLFFIFGIILIISANWDIFITQSQLFIHIKNALK